MCGRAKDGRFISHRPPPLLLTSILGEEDMVLRLFAGWEKGGLSREGREHGGQAHLLSS